MNPEEAHVFSKLKSEIVTTFLQNHAASTQIEDWKGDTITLFQEDLFHKVKATVSEKWFYTYFKNRPEKLPRIDMLNLLSTYVGFSSWDAFLNAHIGAKQELKSEKNKLKKSTIAIASTLFIGVLCYFLIGYSKTNTYKFCFIDAIKRDQVSSVLDVKILLKNESPIHLKTNDDGCFEFKTKHEAIQFVVQSPYYKTDTITRTAAALKNNQIHVQTDDYALMLDYYSNQNLEDYNLRKKELEKLFADNALIYELFRNNLGIQLYTKEEFIRKLTIPTEELKRVKILEKAYQDKKIVKLKFMIE